MGVCLYILVAQYLGNLLNKCTMQKLHYLRYKNMSPRQTTKNIHQLSRPKAAVTNKQTESDSEYAQHILHYCEITQPVYATGYWSRWQ